MPYFDKCKQVTLIQVTSKTLFSGRDQVSAGGVFALLTLGARLAFGLSSAALPVSDTALLAVFLATFFATARGFFTGASPASFEDSLLPARAGFAAIEESATTLPLSASDLRLRGALADTGAGDSEGTCAAPSAVLGEFALALRTGFGFSAVGLPAFVDDASLTDDGFTDAETRSLDATDVCVAITGGVVPGLCSAVEAPALRCSVPTSSL